MHVCICTSSVDDDVAVGVAVQILVVGPHTTGHQGVLETPTHANYVQVEAAGVPIPLTSLGRHVDTDT